MKDDHIQKKIRLVSFKVTDFHLEVSAPKEQPEPSFDLKLRDLRFHDSPNWFAKVFDVRLDINFPFEVVKMKIEYQTVFDISEPVDDKFLKSPFAQISAPAIGFPYVRAFISTVSVQAGIPPIILPSINFVHYLRDQGITVAEP